MNKLKYIGLSLTVMLGFSSCDSWLDINENPNTPTQNVATVESRLPWIQHHYGYAAGSAGMRSAMITGMLTSHKSASTSATNMHNTVIYWNPNNSFSTTPYQHWFVGSGPNIADLITKAETEGAYHYIGVAHVIRAMGFMLMLDWYGEIPYTESLGSFLTPKYDDGKTIFEGCLAELDEAMTFLNMEQAPNATPLSKGDSWNKGDVEKWKALVYGLKVRWLNNLSKKGMYNPDAILEALQKAPTNNNMNIVINHINDPGDTSKDALAGDPLKTSFIFDSAAWSDHIRTTKWYTNLFEYPQPDGTVAYDPRREKMLPMNQHYNKGESWFMLTQGVDVINTDILNQSGPATQNYMPATKNYLADKADRLGDTIYVTFRNVCCAQGGKADESFFKAADGTILSTGTYYSRPESPTDVLCYPEMCFVKAEVLLRKGDRGGALTAYKEGVKAHLEMMNAKLKSYGTTNNPGKNPMNEDQISQFLASNCLEQDAASLTMAEIMKQKYIAMTFTQQNWNDMRRFNYSAGNVGDFGVVYPGMDRPKSMASEGLTKFPGAGKTDVTYWWRRMAQCSHELNYNAKQMAASNPKAMSADIWSVPVWWDTAE